MRVSFEVEAVGHCLLRPSLFPAHIRVQVGEAVQSRTGCRLSEQRFTRFSRFHSVPVDNNLLSLSSGLTAAISIMASPLSFVLTPSEARTLQQRLHRLGVPLPTPPKKSNKLDTTSSTAQSPTEVQLLGSSFWLQDEKLPKTSRTAIRSATSVALVNVLVRALGEALRSRR